MYGSKLLIIVVVLGILLRLVLATLPGFKIDINSFSAWAMRLNQLGLANFYSPLVFTDYTPGYLYILYLLGFIQNLFQLATEQFHFVLKLPAIIAEVILGLICFLEVYKKNFTKKTALFISCLIFFNLGLIFNSSIWGQVDSVLTLFLVLTIYFLKRSNYLLTSLTYGLAFLIKPQAIALAPLFLLYLVKMKFFYQNKNKLLWFLVPGFLVVFILSLPFFPTQPFTGLINRVLETTREYPYTSLFAYNFWGIIGTWIKDDTLGWFNLAYQYWGYILLTFYWSLLIFLYFKKSLPLYTLAALATLGFYFLPTRVHERYLYPALIFLIFAAIELRSTFLLIAQIFLSLLYLLSLYRVYIYYNFIYDQLPLDSYNQNFYQLLEPNDKLLSFVSFFIFIIITFYVFKRTYAKTISN